MSLSNATKFKIDVTPYQTRHSGPTIDRARNSRSRQEIQKRGQWKSCATKRERDWRGAGRLQVPAFYRKRDLKKRYVMDFFSGQVGVSQALKQLGFRSKLWDGRHGASHDLADNSWLYVPLLQPRLVRCRSTRLASGRLIFAPPAGGKRPAVTLVDACIAAASHAGEPLPKGLLAEAALMPSSAQIHLGWVVRRLAHPSIKPRNLPTASYSCLEGPRLPSSSTGFLTDFALNPLFRAARNAFRSKLSPPTQALRRRWCRRTGGWRLFPAVAAK